MRLPVTNKPKRVTKNAANATDHIITNCLLGHLGLFQVYLDSGRLISGIS